MNKNQFKAYQAKFEGKIAKKPLQALAKEEMVAVRPGKMAKSKFALLLGSTFRMKEPVAIDYYGHFKKSSGMRKWVEDFRKSNSGSQLRMVSVKVVHFASIKVEQLADFAPELVAKFPDFKKTILKARGFER